MQTSLTQSLASYLPALCADLVPGAAVHLRGAVAQLASEGNYFGDDELSNAARVGKGGVEDGNAVVGGVVEVDLIGADAEATHDKQVLGLAKDTFGQLCFGANANDMDVAVQPRSETPSFQRPGHVDSPDSLNELVFRQRRLEGLDLVALLPEGVLTRLIDIFKQQDINVLGVKGLQLLGRNTLGQAAAPARRRGLHSGRR